MQRTVTILLSDKRSGSTLLEQELCKHSAIAHISYTPHTYNETHYWLKAACLLTDTAQQFEDGVRPPSYGSRTECRKSLLNFLQRNVPGFAASGDDRALVFNGWEALCDQFANPVFFEKSPQHPHQWVALELLLSWIKKTGYRVKVIGLVRNPLSVMYSALKLFHTDPQKRQFGWALAYENILRLGELLGKDRFHFVRYEDIVAQPVIEFSKLCGFIGLEYEPAVGQSVHSSSINKWKDDMEFLLQLDESVSVLAMKLGYSVQDLYNPPKPQPNLINRVRVALVLGFKRRKQKAYNFTKRMMIRVGFYD
ncbi:sulfotransferase [Pseudomonadota bacterium]